MAGSSLITKIDPKAHIPTWIPYVSVALTAACCTVFSFLCGAVLGTRVEMCGRHRVSRGGMQRFLDRASSADDIPASTE
jgi:hypothetical protein